MSSDGIMGCPSLLRGLLIQEAVEARVGSDALWQWLVLCRCQLPVEAGSPNMIVALRLEKHYLARVDFDLGMVFMHCKHCDLSAHRHSEAPGWPPWLLAVRPKAARRLAPNQHRLVFGADVDALVRDGNAAMVGTSNYPCDREATALVTEP